MMNVHIRTVMYVAFFFIILSFIALPAQAVVFNSDGAELNETSLQGFLQTTHAMYTGPVNFFFESDCISCLPAVFFLDDYVTSNPETDLIEHALSTSEIPLQLQDLTQLHNRTSVNLPVVFIGPVGIEGTEDIVRYFSDVYSWYMHV